MKSDVETESGIKPLAVSSAGSGDDACVRLRRFLQAYWLRPENALWMTLRSMALAPIRFARPSADICCGDGVFTFLHLGGAFDPNFDVFRSVANLERVTQSHADMFDHADETYDPGIMKRPSETLEVGIDLKPTLLAKAGRLGLYDRLVQHDGNRALPFAEAEFSTVYCNAAYWVEDIARFLEELRRITRPGGRVILQVKLEAMRDYTLEAHRSVLGDRFMEIIGRGRVACWPSLTDRAAWEARFTSAGLSIVRATPFVTKTHAHIWDIGLRPVAPMLVKMAGALQPETRAAIKREWVDLLAELLEPFCRFDLNLLPGPDEPAEIQYELTRA